MKIPQGEKALASFVRDRCKDYEEVRRSHFLSIYIDACYAIGDQWITEQTPGRQVDYSSGSSVARWYSRYDPSDPELRVTANETTRLIQMVKASTSPTNIEVSCEPVEADLEAESLQRADRAEKAVNAVLEEIGYTENARCANYARTIGGTWGIGLGMRVVPIEIDGEERADQNMTVFDFDPSMLTLDPSNYSPDLHRHEFVIYTDTWTAGKLERMFPGWLESQNVKEDDLKTIGDLDPFKHTMNEVSGGRLFADHARYSKTRGVVVHQVHIRGDDGRYTLQHVIEAGRDEAGSPDADSPESPFGGDGLPLVLIHGHPRFKSPFGLSDVRCLKEDQDKNNLAETLFWRIVQKATSSTTYVDGRWFSDARDEESVAQKFTNRVRRIIIGSPRNDAKMQGVEAPKEVEHKVVDFGLMQHAEQQNERMRRKVHRAAGHEGAVKTHVTADANARNLDEADSVLDERVRADVMAHRRFIHEIVLGTLVKLLSDKTPWAAALLRRHGFSADDLGALAGMDFRKPQVRVILRESSIRRRSLNAKKADLNFALERNAIDGLRYQRILAQYLDTPLDDEMDDMVQKARRAVLDIKAGAIWEPVPLGVYTDLFLDSFRRAMLDRNSDPDTRSRLADAIRAQQIVATQELIMADPKMAFQLQSAAMGVQSGAAPQGAETIDLVSLARSLDQAGGSPSGQALLPSAV
jgi:hypothetical protein